MKINPFMAILFWLNKKKISELGTANIYCRITIDGNRCELSTGKRISPNHWNSGAQAVVSKSPDAVAVNEDLESLKGDLRRIYNQLSATNKYVTSEMVKMTYTGKGREKRTILELFAVFNNLLKERLEQKRIAYTTWQKSMTLIAKLRRFLLKEYGVDDKALYDMDSAFGENFRHYLIVHDNLAPNTINKYLKITRQVLDYGKMKKWISENPMAGIKYPYRNPPRLVLTMEELLDMQNCFPSSNQLIEIRDVFVFSCYTGYAFKDVYNLTPDNIVIGMDGKKWITVMRYKTAEPQTVPLLPVALAIIEKYQEHSYCIAHKKLLPVRSNQKYNNSLKELAKFAGIKKHLTTHIARHTFATTVTLDHDVPLETVSKLLGHRSIKTTQIYAKVSLKKLSNNMEELRERLKDERGE